MEEVVGSIPARSTNFLPAVTGFRASFGVLRLDSGFRQQAHAPLTPAERLKFDPDQVHQFQWLAALPYSGLGAVGSKLENSDFIDYMKPSEFATVVLITFRVTLAKQRHVDFLRMKVREKLVPRAICIASHAGVARLAGKRRL